MQKSANNFRGGQCVNENGKMLSVISLDLRDARAYALQGRLNQFEASFFVTLRLFVKDKSSPSLRELSAKLTEGVRISREERIREARETGSGAVFSVYAKFGLFTFGGGWSIVAQMQKLYVEQEKVITSEELLDLTSVGRSLPGTMIGNVAMLYGYRVAGVAGGMALPVRHDPAAAGGAGRHHAKFYTAFQNNLWVAAAMCGIRAAVVPIMISAVLGMVGSAFRYPPCYAVMLLVIALYLFFNVNCVYLVVIGAVCGLLDCGVLRAEGGQEA